jgi:uncharacterized protein (DUF58 family)
MSHDQPRSHTAGRGSGGYPPEVAVSLEDLMRYEYLVQAGNILPAHPVYSLLAGRHASKLRGRGMDFEEVRLYVPGDDIRNIDWRVTARTGDTHSKVFNEEKERPTFIILDQGTHMFFGSEKYVKSVTAAQAAALGAFYTLKRGDRVGGIVFNEEGSDFISPKRSKALAQHFLQCMVNRNVLLPSRKSVNPGPQWLNEVLKKTLSYITHDYVITVISDFSQIDTDTHKYLGQLSRSNDVIIVHIYDPLEASIPDGRWVIGNGKRQADWNNGKRNWGKTYREDFKKTYQALTQDFRKYRIPVGYFDTASPVEDQVKSFFYGSTN